MSDKQGKVAKPEKTKPEPVKPETTKPESIKPLKADSSHGPNCVRCNCDITEASGSVRAVCSACDLTLQEMHWNIEHALFRKVTYMPEAGEASWFVENGFGKAICKPPTPRRRNFFKRHAPSEAMAL
jgi:hypothetical protein